MVWVRHLDPRSGRISQTGEFLEAGKRLRQHAFGYRIPDTGYRIPDTGYRIPDTGYRIPDTGYRKQEIRQMAGRAGFGQAETGLSLNFQPGQSKAQAIFYVRCAP